MDRDLKKVVILLAHPNMKESQANKALVDAVKDIEEVAIYNLYELQTNGAKLFHMQPLLSISSRSTGCLPPRY